MTASAQGDQPGPKWDMGVQRHLLERRIPKKEEDLPKVLYHYTAAAGLQGILRTRTMWATDVRYLNDAAELQHGLRIVAAEVDALKQKGADPDLLKEWYAALKSSSNVLVYVASFSTFDDSLSQWRAYARPWGFALGLDIIHALAVSNAPKDTVLIYPCMYKTADQQNEVNYGVSYLYSEGDLSRFGSRRLSAATSYFFFPNAASSSRSSAKAVPTATSAAATCSPMSGFLAALRNERSRVFWCGDGTRSPRSHLDTVNGCTPRS